MRILNWLLPLTGFTLLAAIVAKHGREARDALSDANIVLLAAGIATAVVAMALVGLAWHGTLRLLDVQVSRSAALRWFAPGQLGKYVPGGFWQIVGQAERAAQRGVPRRTVYGATVLSTALLLASVPPMIVLGFALGEPREIPLWLVVTSFGFTVLMVEPHVLRRAAQWFGIRPDLVSSARVAKAIALGAPVWLAVGASTGLVARSVSDNASPSAIGVAAIAAWACGIVAVPAPGGAGVREAVFLATVPNNLGAGAAVVIVLLSRLAFVVADVLLLAVVRLLPITNAEIAP